ncbi:minor tail protein [Mycobacterium phage Acolyte]|nr:minor tail protein [Mycobacterium phage Acolyte]
MTGYPTSPLEAIGADGAFKIGGGDFQFGQDYTEQAVKALIPTNMPTAANAITQLEEHLLKLPLEALQGFRDLLPDVLPGDFTTVPKAVAKIMASLTDGPAMLLRGEFGEFLARLASVPGELLGFLDMSQITGLPSLKTIINQILDILGGHVVTPINDGVQAVKDWWASTTTGVQHAAQNIQATWNQFWGALIGRTPDADATVAEPAQQIGELASTTSANSSAIAELQRRMEEEGTSSGIAGGDDFERVNATNVGPGWAEFYQLGAGNGYYSIQDGHQAAWTDQGAQQNTARFVRTDPADQKTVTDYQKMTLVVGTISGEVQSFLGGSHIRLWTRVNDNAPTVGITDGVYVEIGGASLAQIGYRRNGVDKFVGSAVSCTWGAGTIFALAAGTKDGIEKFEFSKNGSTVATWSDDGVVSGTGPNFRRWAWEGQARNRGTGQGTPCSVTRVTITDNDPTGTGGGSVNLGTGVVGTLGIDHGGTGATTAAQAKSNLGLGSVDNTSDASKPISTATQAALNDRPTTAAMTAYAAAKATTVSGSKNGTASALTVWVGTEAQYAAIATKDPNTLYCRTA